MLIKKASDFGYSEVTPHALYLRRREFLQTAAGAAVAAAAALSPGSERVFAQGQKLQKIAKSSFSTTEEPNKWFDVTGYNNFYEFGTDKADPKANAQKFVPRPWSIKVEGLVKTPGQHDLDTLIKPYALEE